MTLILCLVVLVFAVVQSVFGVGLLVFGTPALLLLGLPFDAVLAYLLPSSIVLSVLQVMGSGGVRLDPLRRRFLLLTAPVVLLGTVFILTAGTRLDIRLLVAAMLVVTGVIRLAGRTRAVMARIIRRHLPGFLVGLGVIHGISNLGGGVLALIVGSIYDAREDVRRQIAFCYGMMAILQLATLLATVRVDVNVSLCLLLPALAGATYVTIGDRTFRATGQTVYQHALTMLIIAFGIALVVR